MKSVRKNERNRQPGSGKPQKLRAGNLFLLVQEINKSFIRPHKVCVSRLKSVDQNILSVQNRFVTGHKYAQSAAPQRSSTVQRRQIHDLIPELFIFRDRQIQLGQYAAEIKAVARSAIRCNAECHVFSCRRAHRPCLPCIPETQLRYGRWPSRS